MRPGPGERRGRPAWRRTALLLPLAGLLAAACRPPPPRPAVATLSVSGAGAGRIHGLDLTVALPAGATVAHDAAGRLSAGAVALLGGAADGVVDGTFVPHRAAPSIRLLVASRAGFGDGAILSLTFVPPGGRLPGPGELGLVAATSGADGRPVPNADLAVTAVAPAP